MEAQELLKLVAEARADLVISEAIQDAGFNSVTRAEQHAHLLLDNAGAKALVLQKQGRIDALEAVNRQLAEALERQRDFYGLMCLDYDAKYPDHEHDVEADEAEIRNAADQALAAAKDIGEEK